MGAGKDVGTGDAPKSETVWGTLGTHARYMDLGVRSAARLDWGLARARERGSHFATSNQYWASAPCYPSFSPQLHTLEEAVELGASTAIGADRQCPFGNVQTTGLDFGGARVRRSSMFREIRENIASLEKCCRSLSMHSE
jgi:hypothetical protein